MELDYIKSKLLFPNTFSYKFGLRALAMYKKIISHRRGWNKVKKVTKYIYTVVHTDLATTVQRIIGHATERFRRTLQIS